MNETVKINGEEVSRLAAKHIFLAGQSHGQDAVMAGETTEPDFEEWFEEKRNSGYRNQGSQDRIR